MIVKLWYDQIVAGKKTYKDVPKGLKENVKAMLIENGHEDLIVE